MKTKIFFTTIFLLINCASTSFAGIFFNVKDEATTKAKILFFGFDVADPIAREDAQEIFEQMRRNLKTTDLFEITKNSGRLEIAGGEAVDEKNPVNIVKNTPKNSASKKAANQDPAQSQEFPVISVEDIPDFDKYSKSNINAIVIAQFSYDDDRNLEMRVRMWDVLDRRQFFGKLYTASKPNYKKIANMFSDEIFKAITGEKKSHFNSQILYVAESGEIKNRTKKIVMMDFDGSNRKFLTNGRDLVLTPIFTRNQDEIYYLRYFEGRPQIFSLNMKNSRNNRLGSFRATTFAASVHPSDSNLVLLSAIFDGNSDVYELNIAANTARRLTKSPAIDTTAVYSPDGKSILFVSDRDGSQQLYVMNNSGLDVRKLSNGEGSYAKPAWSLDGQTIAFVRIKNGQFYIGTMSANGRNEKLLVKAYLVEGVKWSPDGRYLVYSKKKGIYGKDSIARLCVVDTVTGFEFELPTPENEGALDPDWAM